MELKWERCSAKAIELQTMKAQHRLPEKKKVLGTIVWISQNLNENQNFIVARKIICEIKLSEEVGYHTSESPRSYMLLNFFKIFQTLQPCLFLGSCNYKPANVMRCNLTSHYLLFSVSLSANGIDHLEHHSMDS